jgi:hypothetical protein
MDAAKRESWLEGPERQRSAPPDERLRAAADQRRIALDFLRGGIRARHPGISDEELENRVGIAGFGEPTWGDIRERRRRCRDRH